MKDEFDVLPGCIVSRVVLESASLKSVCRLNTWRIIFFEFVTDALFNAPITVELLFQNTLTSDDFISFYICKKEQIARNAFRLIQGKSAPKRLISQEFRLILCTFRNS